MANLDRVVSYVELNLENRIKVAVLAQIAQLSPAQFSRVFRRAFGVSPRRYVRLRRLDTAMLLMRTTTESLSAIALLSGHCDQSHFTRAFRQIVGVSPRQWRHNVATHPPHPLTSSGRPHEPPARRAPVPRTDLGSPEYSPRRLPT
jgi:AraC family transcriptional regulator